MDLVINDDFAGIVRSLLASTALSGPGMSMCSGLPRIPEHFISYRVLALPGFLLFLTCEVVEKLR